jgi:VanZ family protein
MLRFIKRICAWKLLPVFWTLVTIFLLCLPGSTLPNEGFFSIPHFDKYVHVILFGGIVLLWGFHLYFRRTGELKWRETIIFLTLFTINLGIVLEFLQLYCIPNRSFDNGDIFADMGGAVAAGLFHWFANIK